MIRSTQKATAWEFGGPIQGHELDTVELTAHVDYRTERHAPFALDKEITEDILDSSGAVFRATGSRIPSSSGERVDHDYKNLGGNVQADSRFLDLFSVTLGLRFDDHHVYGLHWSPRAGLVLAPESGDCFVKALYGSSFKAPSAEALYTHPSVPDDVIGNAANFDKHFPGHISLEEQSAQSWEIAGGMRLGPMGHLQANAYVVRVEGRVEYLYEDAYFRPRNELEEYVVGGETELRVEPTNRLKAWLGGETIDIGVACSTVGAYAQYEPRIADATQMAAEQINAQGGVLGKQLRIVASDDMGDSETAKQFTRDLVAQNAVARIGPVLAPYPLDTASEAERLKIPMFPYQSNAVYTSMPFVFTTVPPGRLAASVTARRALAAGEKRMAIVWDETYKTDVAEFELEYTALEREVTSKHAIDANSDFVAVLNEIFLGEPDAVALMTGSPMGIPLLNAFTLNYPASRSSWRMWGKLCDNKVASDVSSFDTLIQEVVSGAVWGTGKHVDDYDEAYKARLPETGRASGLCQFDAVYALALAMETAKTTDRVAIRDALAGISKDGTSYTWEQDNEAVAAVARGEDINYEGVSSPFDLDENGDLTPETPRFFICLNASESDKIITASDPL